MTKPSLAALALLASSAACGTGEPVYIDPSPRAIEVDPANMMSPSAVATVRLPVRQENAAQSLQRQRLAMTLGLTPEQVPQARRDDYEVSLEWTVKNLSDTEGTAKIFILGGNEFFFYDPTMFQVDPRDPPPPPLLGGIPIVVPALGQVSGVFREDQIAEASQDWDAISRAGVVAENALLTQWPSEDVSGGTGGELTTIPSPAVAALIQLDVTLDADQHMVLEYTLRVRDHGTRLAPFETDLGALVPPSMTAFTPPPPAEMP
jgi:predicted small lipoprotein YifL